MGKNTNFVVDDTSDIFYESPQSMGGIQTELDYFACITGLKIYFSKTNWYGLEVKKNQKKFITPRVESWTGTLLLLIYLVLNFLLI